MKKILFVCVENAGRSQIAEGFAKKYGTKGFSFSSAGTNPADKVNSIVVMAMKEKGIDISNKKPKPLTFELIKNADLVVTMGCRAQGVCTNITSKPSIDWQLEDPKGKSIDKVREIRDDIEMRINILLKKNLEINDKQKIIIKSDK